MTETDGEITRDALEEAFRDLQGEVDRATPALIARVLPVLAVVMAAAAVAAFWLGRRAGRKRSTVVEIRRI